MSNNFYLAHHAGKPLFGPLGRIENQDPHHAPCLEYISESFLHFAKEYLEEIPSLELKC